MVSIETTGHMTIIFTDMQVISARATEDQIGMA